MSVKSGVIARSEATRRSVLSAERKRNSKRHGFPRTIKVLAMTNKGMLSYPTKNREERKNSPLRRSGRG